MNQGKQEADDYPPLAYHPMAAERQDSLRLRLVRAGYVPIPLYGKAPPAFGKNNSHKGLSNWQALREITSAQIELWEKTWPDANNTGILTRSTPALDLDILNEEAARAVEDLVRERYEEAGHVPVRIGKPPKRVILFRTEEPFEKIVVNVVAPNAGAEKIEFLSDGQQVVVDGIHPETMQPYRWHGGQPGDIARDDLPYIREAEAQALVDDIVDLLIREFGYARAAPRPKAKKTNGGAGGGGADDWQWLLDNIRNGRDLHASLRDLAAKMIKSGTNGGAVINQLRALMRSSSASQDDRWQDRYDDIPRLVESAAEFRQSQDNKRDDGGVAKQPSSEALMDMKFEPLKYVVPGLIVEGLTLFAGKPKIGKSWLFLHVAVAVARGEFTLGEIHCNEGDVLYCALEDSLRRLQSRMTKLFGVSRRWPSRLQFRTEMPRLIDGGLKVITDWIKSVERPRLVIIDTLAMVRAPKRAGQDSYEADYAAVKELRALAHAYGIAIVLIHHLRKAEADDPYDTISGTLGLTGAPDSILVLRRDSSGGIILYGRGRDLAEIEKGMTFNKEACTWAIAGEADELRASDTRRRILAAMAEIGGEATPTEIAAVIRSKAGTVRMALLRMAKDGLVERGKFSKYRVATPQSV